ncbi:unnamed protein product, partial [Closterium sp. Yama58-4]
MISSRQELLLALRGQPRELAANSNASPRDAASWTQAAHSPFVSKDSFDPTDELPWVEKLLQLAACVAAIHRFARRLLDARSAAISAAATASLAASLPASLSTSVAAPLSASAPYSLAGAAGGITSVSESGRDASHRVLAGAAAGASGLQCALATCVEEEALLPYTHEVDRLFSSPPPVRTIWAKLSVYEQLLTGLVRVTSAIEQHNLTGAHLLRYLEQESSFGPCLLSVALDTGIRHCQRVWLGQLAHWMAFGTLPPDGGAEFFITSINEVGRMVVCGGADGRVVGRMGRVVGRMGRVVGRMGVGWGGWAWGGADGACGGADGACGGADGAWGGADGRGKGRTKHAWDEQRVHDVVEAARKRAAHRLWQLVVRESDLFGHLHAAHYILLGGGGAFMQSVWQSLRELLAQPDVRARVANDKLQLAVEKASACIVEETTLKYFRTFSF